MELTRAARPLVRAALVLALTASAAHAQSPAAAVDPYFEFLLARHLEGEGDNDGALAALQRAATAEPESAEVRAEIAAFHLRHNRRAEAEKAAREALAINADSMEGNRVLGLLLATNVEREPNPQLRAPLVRDAITHLERAVAGATGVPDVNVNYTLGRLYLLSGESEKATQALARVLSLSPGSRQARLTMAQAQRENKDLKGAIQTLEEIVDDEPSVAAALAQYQLEAGLLREAVDSYTLALTVAPTNRQIKARRILILYDLKDYQRAATLAAEAQKQHPEDPQFPRLQASALYAAGDTPRAIQVLEGAIAGFPRDTPSRLALVDMYQTVKRFADAERVLRQMLAADPGSADALNSLGYMLANNNDRLDEAIRLITQALQREPGNPAFLDSLGWAHFKKGNLVEAEKYLTEAVAKLPKNAEVLDHVGDLHARRSQWQDAINWWTQALDGEGSAADKNAIRRKIDDAKGRLPDAR